MTTSELDELIPKKRPRSMAEYLMFERSLQASGKLDALEMEESFAFCREIESHAPEDIVAYDFFLSHMPDDSSEITLVILKGHLLIEHKIWEFVSERLLSPKALIAAQLTSHQVICLAESLCLPNDDPTRLWQFAKRLNKLRNDLAHNLEATGISDKIKSFVADYKKLQSVSGDIFGCLGHFYSQVACLAKLARTAEFSTRGR